jgi:tetratricopeptide (TPR) repeat protein
VPFFLVSCAHALRAGTLDGAMPGNVPWDIAQGIRQRMAAQPESTREILQAAAVIGRVVPYSLLVPVTGQPEEEVAAAVDAACRVRLLMEEGQATYRFVHDVIREVVERDVGAARRRSLHQRIGEVLEALPRRDHEKHSAELAWHFLEGNDPERAFRYAVEAGDAAEAVFAHAEAEELYRTALELAVEAGDTRGQAGALTRLGKVLSRLARYDDSLSALEEAARLFATAGDQEAERETVALIGTALGSKGAAVEGIARLQAKLSWSGEAPPSRGLGLLYQSLAQLLGILGRYREMLETADRLAQTAEAIGDAELTASAALLRANTVATLGDKDSALRMYEDALRLAEQTGDLAMESLVLGGLAEACFWVGDLSRYLTLQRRLLDLAEKEGDPAHIGFRLIHMALALHEVGEWDEAQIYGERARQIVDEAGQPAVAASVYAVLLTNAERMGDWDAAHCYAETGLAIADRSRELFVGAWLREVRAELDIPQGRAEEVVAALPEYIERCRNEGVGFERLVLWPLAWAELELGHIDRAEELSRRVMDSARRDNDRIYILEGAPVRTAVLRCLQRWEEAERVASEALAVAEAAKRPYSAGRIHHELGLLHAARQDCAAARRELEAALDLFQRLGARPFIDRTRQALMEIAGGKTG